MSESDDSDILADIEALDKALALKKTQTQPHDRDNHLRSDNIYSTDTDSENDDNEYFNFLNANRNIDESLNAFEINTRLIAGLTITKKKVIDLLVECDKKIEQLDEKMIKSTEESNLGCKLAISNAGMPYFKDKNFFSAPKNSDTKLKEARGELLLLSCRTPSRWSGRDREILLRAIHNEAIESVLSGKFNEKIDRTSNKKTMKHETVETLVLPRNFNEMVGAVGEREFDWYKISAMDFENKHSPGECRSMWNVYLHPDFRKDEWTNAEDNQLLKCAKECKYQDWDTITQNLGTNRSAYQCFIRYNTIKKVPFSGLSWTKQEDRQLMKIMNALKIGNYIPWTEIANHLRHRTKQQIYTRWVYRKAPHLRKGRFTYTETNTLLQAVQIYGQNFCKISNKVMPSRTSIQLQDRYRTVMANINGYNIWTYDDDVQLIRLHRKHNNNWSKISMYYSDKSRTQVRHRYTALLKYMNKGVSLEDVPRPCASSKNKISTNNTLSASEHCNKNALEKPMHRIYVSDIRSRLYEALCFPPLIKTNLQEKPYDAKHLDRDIKKLYNTLHFLNANLDIPGDFLNYVHLNKRDKQLLVSLKEYINIRNNKIQNRELIEKFRVQMFGYDRKISGSSRFIPPLPFDGYIRTKKIKNKNKSINCDLDVNEKFLIDVPTDFSIMPCTFSFISIEEEIQFHRLSQFLISNYHNCYKQNVDLYKSNLLKSSLFFDKGNTLSAGTSLEYKSNVNSKISLEDCKQIEQLNKQEITSTEHINEDEETNMFSDIILPNQATLVGFKNLLLWKLLYEYENESHCELSKNDKRSKQSVRTCSIQTESVEYQLLRTRLLQLFKLPISLSNTMLETRGPEAIFLTKEEQEQYKTELKKRKFEDTASAQPNKKNRHNALDDSDLKFESDVKIVDLPIVRSCKIVSQKYRIVAK